MKRLTMILFLAAMASVAAHAGLSFGIQAGAFSPTKSLDNNDNGLALGANIQFKFAFIGVKVEGFYIDSSGRYADELGDEFSRADLDIENILAADLMFYPIASTFFIQAGLHYINIDEDGFSSEVLDNETGLDLGLGFTFFDKLQIQGKIMYTPDAVKDDAVDTIEGLDDADLVGYIVTVGWQF